MAKPLEVALRDEDIQAIITGLAKHQATLEGVANRLQAPLRHRENQENGQTDNTGTYAIGIAWLCSLGYKAITGYPAGYHGMLTLVSEGSATKQNWLQDL